MRKLARRRFLQMTGAAAVVRPEGAATAAPLSEATTVNDIHSQLNPTVVERVLPVDSVKALRRAVIDGRRDGKSICIAGGRHAMGGQQFAAGARLVDTRPLARVLHLDSVRGRVEVEAGIQWPALIRFLVETQRGHARQWGIAQKQTGADRLSIGGGVAANIHSRGLRMKPFVADVESLTLVDAGGRLVRCDRERNAELFRLVNGGYGLFGPVAAVTLRLVPRRKLERVVELISAGDLMPAFDKRIAQGFLYGDFQFAIDAQSPDFLRRGVFSCYRPVPDSTPVPERQQELAEDDWTRLLYLAHADKSEVFRRYSEYYLSTAGQIYWSDTHQLSVYPDNYHRAVDKQSGARDPATEIITEIYVPRPQLADFLEEARADFRKHRVEVIYGTVRLIERDDESFLAWARQPYACTIFNLHTVHTPAGQEHSAEAFRRLIDMAIRRAGSYYLTYHKYARRDQVEACYPQFRDFLRLKKKYDPDQRFQSDWYRHYRKMFEGS